MHSTEQGMFPEVGRYCSLHCTSPQCLCKTIVATPSSGFYKSFTEVAPDQRLCPKCLIHYSIEHDICPDCTSRVAKGQPSHILPNSADSVIPKEAEGRKIVAMEQMDLIAWEKTEEAAWLAKNPEECMRRCNMLSLELAQAKQRFDHLLGIRSTDKEDAEKKVLILENENFSLKKRVQHLQRELGKARELAQNELTDWQMKIDIEGLNKD